MSDIEWGAPIEVNGVRPGWLRRSDAVARGIKTGAGWVGVGADDPYCDAVENWYWGGIIAIRLPANHPYYLATSRGFTYWPGGESAPADYDGGPVLVRSGDETSMGGWGDDEYWQHDGLSVDTIGYRKRTEQPAPAIAPELVERMVRLVKLAASGSEVMHRARAILAELEPADPDMELAKSINGDVEAIAAAIKAARENGR